MKQLSTSGQATTLKLHFNLKQTREQAKLTQIILTTTVNHQRIRIYTKQRVEPHYWDKTAYRCRAELAPNLRERMQLDDINQLITHVTAALHQADKQLAQKGKYLSRALKKSHYPLFNNEILHIVLQ